MARKLPAVATKARHLKTPIQLWIVDNRKRLGLEPADLARLTGVSEDTARGWESRGKPSEDALVILEQRFGQPVPRGEQAIGDFAAVVAAIDRQTAAIVDAIEARDQVLEGLLSELGKYRQKQVDVLRALQDTAPRAVPMPADEPEPDPPEPVPTRSVRR